jgi:hypothetical protein
VVPAWGEEDETATERLPPINQSMEQSTEGAIEKYKQTIDRAQEWPSLPYVSTSVEKLRHCSIIVCPAQLVSEKQVLGTETARVLRAKEVKSKICDLSASDIKQSFLDSLAREYVGKS